MMQRSKAHSVNAKKAYGLVEALQKRLVEKMESISCESGEEMAFKPVEWFRDGGKHGGGIRYEAGDISLFNRASVNISQVHYDDPSRKLSSATALSAIIHPKNPRAPSVHMHISWTEMRGGQGYWRIMADLNPAIVNSEDTEKYVFCLKEASGRHYDEASAQGDRYFYIPVLKRHRGVTHFYLENYNSGDAEADFSLAERVGNAAVDCYADVMGKAVKHISNTTSDDYAKQLAYHTLYFFQVLTLDRGTTSGLLIHDQNDVGILGSLPAAVERNLLISWKELMPSPQDKLLERIIKLLPDESPAPIEESTKQQLAKAVREHYREYPEALHMQASGETVPTTVDNHR